MDEDLNKLLAALRLQKDAEGITEYMLDLTATGLAPHWKHFAPDYDLLPTSVRRRRSPPG
mgnify:CR=1 FL=1